MEITFFRYGHANNSSSSHSLIFINQSKYDKLKKKGKIGTDEVSDFGHGLFTVNDRNVKLTYFLQSVCNYFIHTTPDDGNDDVQDGVSETIAFVIKNDIYQTLYECTPTEAQLTPILSKAYVDHQSLISFPVYRDPTKGLNVEFLKDFLLEVIKENYAILGGGDGGYQDDHALYKHREKEETDLIKLWSVLLEGGSENILCEKDNLTDEYILSFTDSSGTLMKVKF